MFVAMEKQLLKEIATLKLPLLSFILFTNCITE